MAMASDRWSTAARPLEGSRSADADDESDNGGCGDGGEEADSGSDDSPRAAGGMLREQLIGVQQSSTWSILT